MISSETAASPAQKTAHPAGAAALPAWLQRLADRRRPVVLLALAAAILLPEITISPRLPNVRLEQLALPYGLLVLWVDHRLGRPFCRGPLDWIVAALAASTLLSILGAPLILGTRLSPRDFYELVKPALYYVLYRLARGAALTSPESRDDSDALLLAGSLSATLGVFQYFDWLRVNAWLSPLYAPPHHLTVLRESGRVVGTIGNPNYFGIFCVILALAALLALWLGAGPSSPPSFAGRLADVGRLACRRDGKGAGGLGLILCPTAALALATLGLVFSGSRTALLALAVGLGAVWLLGLRRRQSLVRLMAASAALIGLLLLAVVVAEAVPHGQVDYLGRLTEGLSPREDASFGLRLARWRSFIDAWRPHKGAAGADPHRALTSVHATGSTSAGPETRARDAQRKADLLHEAVAIDAYHAQTGRWPTPDGLTAALTPRYLPALPLDPATDQPYADVPTVTGYSVLARLEDTADPDYPIFGIGSSPNYLRNGDLEQGGGHPANWDAIPGTSFASERGDALYGERALLYRGGTGRAGQRVGVFQQRYFGRPGGNPFTATVWVKLPGPESGRLDLYANVIYADGTRADPLTRIPVDLSRTGVWQKVSLGILPLAGSELSYLGIYVVSEGFSGEALLDGFQLVDGPVPLSFALTREAPPSDTLGFNPEARLRRSPLIGVGPEKGSRGGSVDNEYLLYAARYGLLGILAYLALYVGTLTLAVRAFLCAGSNAARLLAALVAASLAALIVFNLTAGSFYELQLMAIFWILAGAALAAPDDRTAEQTA